MKILILLIATLFTEANTQYANGDYQQAATLYEQILTQCRDAEVYYNLGNAYFKQGELAKSILAYERCLRLDPRNKDAQHNLEFAQSRIVDNITETRTFFLSTWMAHIRNMMKEPTWMLLSIVFFIVTLTGALLFALSRSIGVRKSAFYAGIAGLLLTVVGLSNAASLHHRDTVREEAIVTRGIVNAKAAPDRSGTELFTLHEGTKVTVHETIGDWGEIHVGNNVGWIELANLERI